MKKPQDIRIATPDRIATFNLAIGTWLKDARIKRGMSVDEGALAIRSSCAQLEAIENGLHSLAGSEFHALIAAYKLPLEDVNDFLAEYGLRLQP